MKSKRGVFVEFFSPVVVITFIIAMTVFLILAISNYESLAKKKAIGENSLELIRAYSQGEKAMFFIDRSAELAAEEAVYELAEFGGNKNPEIYADDEYTVWYDNGEEYFSVDTIEESYKIIFNEKMRNYLLTYPETNVRMPSSFDIKIEKGTMIVNSLDHLIVGASPNTRGPYVPSGECPDIALLADQYVQNSCPYSKTSGPGLLEPDKCSSGLTCATFVQSVYKYSMGITDVHGNGNSICNSAGMYKFKETAQLQPGDIFSASSCTSLGRIYGHTGIYIGRGHVEEPIRWICYKRFIPDPSGEPVFVHSVGPVCYSTYSDLFGPGKCFQNLITFCRHPKCTEKEGIVTK